jgi:hypothetical protein
MIEKYEQINKEIKEENKKVEFYEYHEKIRKHNKKIFKSVLMSFLSLYLFVAVFFIWFSLFTDSFMIFREFIVEHSIVLIALVPLAYLFLRFIKYRTFEEERIVKCFATAVSFLALSNPLFALFHTIFLSLVYFFAKGSISYEGDFMTKNNYVKAKSNLKRLVIEKEVITQKILSDAVYLDSILSNKKHEKELKEIYSTVIKEKPWQEKLMDKALNNKDFLLINS